VCISYVYRATVDELADSWFEEWKNGIKNTDIRSDEGEAL